MPMPATHQAMIAPSGPVARAKLRGREKMPAPTMEPTTIAVSAGNDSFVSAWDAMVHRSERLVFFEEGSRYALVVQATTAMSASAPQ
jgi:hypothetical protein